MTGKRRAIILALAILIPTMLLFDVMNVSGVSAGASIFAPAAHFVGLVLLTVLVCSLVPARFMTHPLLLGAAIGLENLQRLSPTRQFQVSDVYINMLGVVAGILLAYILTKRQKTGPESA